MVRSKPIRFDHQMGGFLNPTWNVFEGEMTKQYTYWITVKADVVARRLLSCSQDVVSVAIYFLFSSLDIQSLQFVPSFQPPILTWVLLQRVWCVWCVVCSV